jgi:hypothetical protein
MLVKFNDISEYCEELKKEKDHIDRNIVRLTNQMGPTALSPSIRNLSVISTYANCFSYPTTIVRLEHYCGQLWGMENQDTSIREAAEKAINQIEAVCKELGLEVRAGVIEDAPETISGGKK